MSSGNKRVKKKGGTPAWNFLMVANQIKQKRPLIYRQFEKDLLELADLTKPLFRNSIMRQPMTKMAKQLMGSLITKTSMKDVRKELDAFLSVAKEASASSAMLNIEEQIKETEAQLKEMEKAGASEEEIAAMVETSIADPIGKMYQQMEESGMITDEIKKEADAIVDEVQATTTTTPEANTTDVQEKCEEEHIDADTDQPV